MNNNENFNKTPKYILDKIRAIMEYKNITQSQVADALTALENRDRPYDQGNISNLLKGRYRLPIDRLFHLSEILEVPIWYILWDDEMDPLDLKIIAQLITMNKEQKEKALDYILRLCVPSEEIERRSHELTDKIIPFSQSPKKGKS